jgi:DNA-binding NarL/FixJ family response regulator
LYLQFWRIACSARGQTAFRIDIFCAENSPNPRSIASMRLNRRQNWASRRASLPLPNEEIAQRLGITEHTVSNYLFYMYYKLGISTRVELVLHIVKQREEHSAAG